MKQMTSVIFSKNICVMHVTEIKCNLVHTGHALDIEGCITKGDITIGLAWWLPYMGKKQL